MLIFHAMLRSASGACARAGRLGTCVARSRAISALAAEGRSESGVTLIEVVISAMLVAIIVVGTLTGFDSASRATTKLRQRNQATLLAGQDQERLRGMNITELGRLGVKTAPIEQNGTQFTIESSAQFVSAAKEEFSCEASPATGDYIQTTSKVSWASLTKQNREPEAVTQSSLVPVPTSSSLLVNVRNQANEDVEGATVKVTGESGATYEQTTPESGCVIFGALPDSKVKITGTKPGWINEQLETEPAATEAQLSTTSLVSKTFAIANPGSLRVEFQSNGSTVGVQGDTVYVAHTGAPEKLIGTVGTYSSTMTVPTLWPYQTAGSPPGPSPYTVYAGCKEANPATISKGEVTTPAAQVEPAATTPVKVELPAVNVKVYEGTSSVPGALSSGAEAKLTYCGGTVRVMKTTAGALEHPYQPYATTIGLCVAQVIGGKFYKYSTTVANTARAGVTVPPIYMKDHSSTSGC
jgi:Tfp pilus assembly protein PilV